jgi:biopolymer transport protein ExbD
MGKRRFFLDDDLAEEPLVNLTPLIDVVFVVLISFMLISPILEIDSIDLATGGTEKKQDALAPESSPLTVIVHKDNTIWMQGKCVSLEQLEKTLRAQKKGFPSKIPQVIHDKAASFGTYQSVKNMFERCGFEQIDIVLKPG